MEISTHDLFQVMIHQNKLQTNFLIIQTVLKSLQQRVGAIQIEIKQSFTQMDENRCHLQKNHQTIANHQNTLILHSQNIKKLYEQINIINQQDADNIQMFFSPNISQHNLNPKELKPQIQATKEQSKNQQNIQHSKGDQQIQIKKQQREVKKPVEKNKFQKIISNFKQRINSLENKQLQTNRMISQIQRQLSKQTFNDQLKPIEMQQKLPTQVERRITKDNVGLQLIENKNLKMNQEYQSIDFDSHQYKNLNSSQKLLKVENEIQNFKQLFIQRMRVLELNLKQSQNKTQSIQKNIDILQRSYQVLKYDFQRTSTSFSKTRNQTTQDKYRDHDSKLNDTRITDRSYYEDKLIQLFHQMDLLKAEYIELAAKIQKQQSRDQLISKNSSVDSSKVKIGTKIINNLHNANQSELLKKELSNCRRDLKKLTIQFQQFAYGVNIGTNEIKTILIKPNENKQDWKSLSSKMFRLKMQLQSNVKQLEGKILSNNDMVVVLNQLETGIQQCKILIKKKVQIVDFQKTIKRVQNKLSNFILQVYEKQGIQNQADASIVKQPWFCLSCDNEFKNYTGKASKHMHIEKMNGKKVNTQNHMVRRNEYSRLPSVLK